VVISAALAVLRSGAITGAVALRAMPEEGGSVLVDYLGSTVRGTVKRVDQDGRKLEIATEDGDTLTFSLNRATATFTADGSQTGARLRFESPPGY
jgi:hypothetical protein